MPDIPPGYLKAPESVTLPTWSETTITDGNYRTKFVTVSKILEDWLAPYGGLSGKHILDFGCGEATTALAIALRNSNSRVVGIDIMDDVEQCAPLAHEQLKLPMLPENLSLHQVKAGNLAGEEFGFDLVYSWSVFEHVNQNILTSMLEQIRGTLRPNGKFFIQIAPLYYSRDGSHLMSRIPEPWGHLTNQTSIYKRKLAATCKSQKEFESLISMLETLNRLTANHLLAAVRGAGFVIDREFRTQEDDPIPGELRDIYQEQTLRTNQIVLLASRA